MGNEKKSYKVIIDKIVSGLLISFVVIMAGLALFFTISRMQNNMVKVSGYAVCYVLTGSMEPDIMAGEVILIREIPPEDIVPGDVITYKSTSGLLAGNYITHEVVSVIDLGTDIQFVTRGVANPANDTEFVNIEKVVGVFQRKLVVMTFLMGILSNSFVFILLIIVPLVLLFVYQIVRVVFGLKEASMMEKEDGQEHVGDQMDMIYGNKVVEDYIKKNNKKFK